MSSLSSEAAARLKRCTEAPTYRSCSPRSGIRLTCWSDSLAPASSPVSTSRLWQTPMPHRMMPLCDVSEPLRTGRRPERHTEPSGGGPLRRNKPSEIASRLATVRCQTWPPPDPTGARNGWVRQSVSRKRHYATSWPNPTHRADRVSFKDAIPACGTHASTGDERVVTDPWVGAIPSKAMGPAGVRSACAAKIDAIRAPLRSSCRAAVRQDGTARRSHGGTGSAHATTSSARTA